MAARFLSALLAGTQLLAGACGRWIDDLACADPTCTWSPGEWERLRTLAGPGPLPPDPTNQWADDLQAARLGQSFFFDAGFSGPSRQMDALRRPTPLGRAPRDQPAAVSCATCHDLARGGADVSSVPGHVSVGAGVTDVNAPSVLNAARRPALFWNGRVDSGWGLAALVGESETTMNGTRLQTAHRLATRYGDPVQAVFGRALPPDWRARLATLPERGKPEQPAYDALARQDRDLATALLVVWAKALAAYGRLLESRDSAFDRYIADGPGSGHLDESARRGARLFVGKAGCIDCHNGPLLADGGFHNVGVPQAGPGVPTEAECVAGSSCDCQAGKACLPWGRLAGLAWWDELGRDWLEMVDAYRDDGGRAPPRVTPAPDGRWKGAWRTPSLRDVALTAPYMHDGVYATLEDVLWHYDTGGRVAGGGVVGVPSVKLKPLGLQADEVADLLAFLKTLTGAPLPAALRDPPPGP